MSERLSIKIKISDREYPMQVDANVESLLRRAGKILNERIQKYRTQFQIEDRQDLLSMVAFDCMVDLLNTENKQEILEKNISEKLDKWDSIITKSLNIE